jgi:hypothetical protein
LTATTRDRFAPTSGSTSVRQAEILKLSPEFTADPDVDVSTTSQRHVEHHLNGVTHLSAPMRVVGAHSARISSRRRATRAR